MRARQRGRTRAIVKAASAAVALALPALFACRETAVPPRPTVAAIDVVGAPAASAPVGAEVGEIVVRVTDASGAAVSGTPVIFTVATGAGDVSRGLDSSAADGTASTTLTLGPLPGANVVTVAAGAAEPAIVQVTGLIGVAQHLAIAGAPAFVRFGPRRDTTLLAARVRDSLGNVIDAPITWTPRDAAIVDVRRVSDTEVVLRAQSRPGDTYLVARSGGARDSVRIITVDSASPPCSLVAEPVRMGVGDVRAFDDGVICIEAASGKQEFAIVTHYGTPVGDVNDALDIMSFGVVPPDDGFPATASAASMTSDLRDHAFERSLRQRERRSLPDFVTGARDWYRAGAQRPRISGQAVVGDLVTLNTNAFDFCGNLVDRVARVAAITEGTIVLADTSNPAGGFTDDEYRSFGVAMDTLVNPVNTAAFGAPTDIDGNGRIVILFTSAVNALTGEGSPGGVILGFYFGRDLLPRTSTVGACPGSNVSEMFYVIVPDPNGTINGNVRSKSYVASNAIGVIAHEYQHLINASRRMYITMAPQVGEEIWLDEGLSHVAEELVFYRASGRTPRANIAEADIPTGTRARNAFFLYQVANFVRYRTYLRAPDANSPLNPKDFVETRGAAWSFLRYMADRTRAIDGDMWYRLVNSQLTGAANVDALLAEAGLTMLTALHDWSISVAADDNPANASPSYQQQSWNTVGIMAMLAQDTPYPLVPRVLLNGGTSDVRMRGGGSGYFRFAVREGRQALIHAMAFRGGVLQTGMRISIVRIK
jgi:hypothetical protein